MKCAHQGWLILAPLKVWLPAGQELLTVDTAYVWYWWPDLFAVRWDQHKHQHMDGEGRFRKHLWQKNLLDNGLKIDVAKNSTCLSLLGETIRVCSLGDGIGKYLLKSQLFWKSCPWLFSKSFDRCAVMLNVLNVLSWLFKMQNQQLSRILSHLNDQAMLSWESSKFNRLRIFDWACKVSGGHMQIPPMPPNIFNWFFYFLMIEMSYLIFFYKKTRFFLNRIVLSIITTFFFLSKC